MADESHTNYMMTQLVLASMLNGTYLDRLGVVDGEPIPSGLLERAIEDPAAVRLLRRAGYETIVIPSGYEGVRIESADVVLDGPYLSEVEGVILEGTAVDAALRGVWPTFVADSVRGRTMDALAAIERLGQEADRVPSPSLASCWLICRFHISRSSLGRTVKRLTGAFRMWPDLRTLGRPRPRPISNER